MSRTTGRRQWNPTISGVQLQKLREREDLSRREVAEHLSRQLGRPVAVQHVREMEEGAEPSQEVFGHLLDLYKVAGVDTELLFPPTEAELDRRRDYDERKQAFERRVEATDKDWQPVRFRGRQ